MKMATVVGDSNNFAVGNVWSLNFNAGASEPVHQVRHLTDQYFRERHIELSISTLTRSK